MFRKRNIEYTIPAHTKLVSNVRFEKNTGEYLISSSYDGTAKVGPTFLNFNKIVKKNGKYLNQLKTYKYFLFSWCLNYFDAFKPCRFGQVKPGYPWLHWGDTTTNCPAVTYPPTGLWLRPAHSTEHLNSGTSSVKVYICALFQSWFHVAHEGEEQGQRG